jgi:hypothetical protein
MLLPVKGDEGAMPPTDIWMRVLDTGVSYLYSIAWRISEYCTTETDTHCRNPGLAQQSGLYGKIIIRVMLRWVEKHQTTRDAVRVCNARSSHTIE